MDESEEFTRQDESALITIRSWREEILTRLDDDPLMHPKLQDLLNAMIDDLYNIEVELHEKLRLNRTQ